MSGEHLQAGLQSLGERGAGPSTITEMVRRLQRGPPVSKLEDEIPKGVQEVLNGNIRMSCLMGTMPFIF